jgi:two-component system CheB/CheR fusion protein
VPQRSLGGIRVLLVDDTPDTLETFGYLLEYEGAAVTPAASAAEALRLAATNEFDLVISDVGMPHMDGYEMIAELRAQPRTAALPAIALTGYGRAQDVQRALIAGFNAQVNKPVDFAQILEAIKSVLASEPPAGSSSEHWPTP